MPSLSSSIIFLTVPTCSSSARRVAFLFAEIRRTTLSSLPVLFKSSISYWPSRLYPCNSETNRFPSASQQTPDGCRIRGSAATSSSLNPCGSLIFFRLSSGVKGLGASVGFIIWPCIWQNRVNERIKIKDLFNMCSGIKILSTHLVKPNQFWIDYAFN